MTDYGKDSRRYLPVLEYLRRQLAHELDPDYWTHLRYPTAISTLLGLQILAVEPGCATLALHADPALHANQQGTIHGGLLCELADAAIGTAHSTVIGEGESFTSIDLKTTFLRPIWRSRLVAKAWSTFQGRTISHYRCEICREDDQIVAYSDSTVMTLRAVAAKGR